MTMLVRFDDLPQPVRERLYPLLSAHPRDPCVLAFEVRTVLPTNFKKLGLIVSSIAIAWCLWFIVERVIRYSIGSDPLTYLILVMAGAVFLSTLVTLGMDRRWPRPPWSSGRWALPGAIIETNGGWLEITPSSTLGKPTLVTVKRNGQYTYSDLQFGKLTFSFASNEAAEAACTRILEAKARVQELVAAGNLAALAEFDPFALEYDLGGVKGKATTDSEPYVLELRPLARRHPPRRARRLSPERHREAHLRAPPRRDAAAHGASPAGPRSRTRRSREGPGAAGARGGGRGEVRLHRLGSSDQIALERMLPEIKGTKICGDLEVELKETELVLYDRRTGAMLSSKRFPPYSGCPPSFIKGPKTGSMVPVTDLRAWLETLVSKSP